MESIFEKIIKFSLLVIVLLGGLLYWLLPKTKMAQKLKMNESLFIVTHVIGIICGIVGLAITFLFPSYIIQWHLWELVVIPFALIYLYWLIIQKTMKAITIVDEKQDFNMTKAAALTMAISIPAMVIMFLLYYNNILTGSIWFPYYFFVTLLFFSGTTLFLFKKE